MLRIATLLLVLVLLSAVRARDQKLGPAELKRFSFVANAFRLVFDSADRLVSLRDLLHDRECLAAGQVRAMHPIFDAGESQTIARGGRSSW